MSDNITINFMTSDQAASVTHQPAMPTPSMPVYTEPTSLRQILEDHIRTSGIQQAASIEATVDATGETLVIRSDADGELSRILSPELANGVRLKTMQSAEAGR